MRQLIKYSQPCLQRLHLGRPKCGLLKAGGKFVLYISKWDTSKMGFIPRRSLTQV